MVTLSTFPVTPSTASSDGYGVAKTLSTELPLLMVMLSGLVVVAVVLPGIELIGD
jgi:hypothetical protein